MATKQICIFGDSLSDIGRMAHSGLGYLGKNKDGLNALPTTFRGRFSDGKIWVDYLWEDHLGCAPMYDDDSKVAWQQSKFHKGIFGAANGGDSSAIYPAHKFLLADYSVGGATATGGTDGIGAIMNKITVRILYSLRDMRHEFEADLNGGPSPSGQLSRELLMAAMHLKRWSGARETVFIIWLGGNDVVTVCRDPSAMPHCVDRILHHADKLVALNGINKVVIANVPDMSALPKQGVKGFKARPEALSKGPAKFKKALDQKASGKKNISVIDMHSLLTTSFLLSEGIIAPLSKATTSGPSDAEAGTVSDLLHPTTHGHAQIAKLMWNNGIRAALGL